MENQIEAEVERHRQQAVQSYEHRQQMASKTREVAARSLLMQIQANKYQKQQTLQEKQTVSDQAIYIAIVYISAYIALEDIHTYSFLY